MSIFTLEYMDTVGYMGIGLVWGWWVGGLSGRVTRPLRDGVAVSAATLLVAAAAFILGGWWSILLFASAIGLTLYLHLIWRQMLIDRFGPPGF